MTYRALKFISRHLWLSSVIGLVLMALVLTAARILLPMLQDYRDDVAAEVSKRVQREVSIEAFEIGWHRLGPRIFLHDVRVLEDDKQSTLLGFKEAHMDIDLWASLLAGQLNIERLSIVGVELQLARHEDGRLGLAGVDAVDAVSDASKKDDGDTALRWLLSQGQMQVLDSTVYWRDMRTGEVLKFHDVNLQLDNSETQHRLSGQLRLPASYGDSLSLAVDLSGRDIHLDSLTGRVYLKGNGLRVPRLLSGIDQAGVLVDRGKLDAQLWLDVNNGEIAIVRGTVDGDELRLQGDDGAAAVQVDAVYGDFVWQKRSYGWELDIDRLRPRLDGVAWPATRMMVRYANGEQGAHIEVASDFVQLEDVASISALLPQLPIELRQFLLESRPRGNATQTYLSIDLPQDEGDAVQYFVSSQLRGLGMQAVNALPGFDGLDGYLNMTHEGGVFEVSSSGGYFDSQGLFRDYIAIAHMEGRLDWRRQEDGWHVFIDDLAIDNNDIHTISRGSLHFPSDGRRPIVSLFSAFYDGDGRQTSRYLPVKVMPEATVTWLDRAIKQGYVSSGAMVLYGALDHFPFDDGSGRFEIRFDVENGLLDYADEWPPLTQVNVEVLFHGRSMTIFGRDARILDSTVDGVEVRIRDLMNNPRVLEVDGNVRGDAADVLKVLTESPLRQRFASYLGDARGHGNSWLELGFHLPLSGGMPDVFGRLQLTQAELEFPEFGLDFAAINGVLGFTDEGISAQGVEAFVMGQPGYVDIETVVQGDMSVLEFRANGHSQLEALAERQPLPVYSFLSGDAPWQASFRVAADKASPMPPELLLETDLAGVAIDLPPPLKKVADEVAPLSLRAEFSREGSLWHLDYDQRLSGLFDLPRGDDAVGRGALALGGEAVLPTESGLSVSVTQPELDLLSWLGWAETGADADRDASAGDQEMAVRWLSLDIDKAQLASNSLHGLKVGAERQPDAWQVQLSSTEAMGSVRLPFERGAPVQLDFERLLLIDVSGREGEDAEQLDASPYEAFNPESLPPLRIRSEYFVFAGMNFGKLELRTSSRKRGVTVDRFRLTSSAADIDFKGSWTQVSGGHSSALNGRITIQDFGDFQSHLGYVPSVDDGDGRIDVDLNWASPMIDPQLTLLRGKAEVDIQNGRLLDVEPGAGRLLGMFGIGTFSRRFSLDFSDVFSQGFAFDEMKGKFAVVDGSVFTRDEHGQTQPMMIKGPAASIELRGRAGFVERDYDQQVAVTPHVTSSLPVWGAVAGGLTTGAAVLVMERLLRSKIDDATRFYYHVSGSWDQPQMVPVDAEGHTQ